MSKSWTPAYNRPALAGESAERKLERQSEEEFALVVVRLRGLVLKKALPARIFCGLADHLPDLQVS